MVTGAEIGEGEVLEMGGERTEYGFDSGKYGREIRNVNISKLLVSGAVMDAVRLESIVLVKLASYAPSTT